MKVEQLTMMFSAPSQSELEEDIEEMKQDAIEDPEDAGYFQIKEGIFERELKILKENPNDDPKTREGALDLINKMKEDKGLEELEGMAAIYAKACPEVCKFGWTIGHRKWFKV